MLTAKVLTPNLVRAYSKKEVNASKLYAKRGLK